MCRICQAELWMVASQLFLVNGSRRVCLKGYVGNWESVSFLVLRLPRLWFVIIRCRQVNCSHLAKQNMEIPNKRQCVGTSDYYCCRCAKVKASLE